MAGGDSEQASGATQLSARASFVRKVLTDLAIMTAIGVFLAVIGPFGSIEQPLAVRLVTWLAFSYLGYAIYSPMAYFVERAHTALALPIAPLWVAAVVVATFPMTAAIYFIQFMPRLPPVPPLEEALTSYFYVFVIGGGVTLLFNVLGLRGDKPALDTDQPFEPIAPEPEPNPEPANPLLDQLPAQIGSDIIALEMEDHYVRVHTALGSELVLMRLRDAMVHVADIEGLQVHRSWWVARGAVEDVKREGRNVRLVLASGLEAPVSRAQVTVLKDAGWV